ncbi:nitrite reductase [Streptomyces sp. CB00316]|uniref:NAD(P)/FAD-dependent oxidoreductase n=1 Tax=unclassified Streptomyces TaxID=2593676 RepID=UPI0009389BA0|nr:MULTISPECIES: FAD-dependent oxidoreductase [unclassified Streptomyces]MBT2377539.1 NAD(P)/FAD-dependent oxidoreductase [Streptomyces sp. ISL-111]MBT2425288.1 NAD(P)/FAD-dependent oxidoreductase [Streptomyces sp. ISL-112]OKJ23842.1 nitrite reductase [Streptomyces sp. CB00316]
MRKKTESAEPVVVIGAGMAGARLAARVPGVTVVGEERHAPYNRVLLADVLSGRYSPDVIALPATEVRRGVRAVRIDRADRLVHCDDGSVLHYGRLVLATGSNPVLPPLRGIGTTLPDGVHPFRTLDDALALRAAVRPGVRAVVIGGGLLGVSAARALAECGAQVVLAQQGEHLMERQLDPEAAALLRLHLEALGVEVHTECRVRGLRCTTSATDGAVRAVELADGYELAADLTVLACGVRPRTGLARAAGLDVRKGIVVDDELRTSDPYIHALGDCAEHRSTLYGLAGPALEQADVLADVLAGRPARYEGTRALTRLTLRSPSAGSFDSPEPREALDLAAFGEARPLPGDDVIRLADATRGAYRTVVVREGRLAGGVLLGDLGAVSSLARTWQDDEPLPPAMSLLHLLTDGGH